MGTQLGKNGKPDCKITVLKQSAIIHTHCFQNDAVPTFFYFFFVRQLGSTLTRQCMTVPDAFIIALVHPLLAHYAASISEIHL